MLESILLLFVGMSLKMPWWYYLVFVIGFVLKLVVFTGKAGVVCLLLKDKTK